MGFFVLSHPPLKASSRGNVSVRCGSLDGRVKWKVSFYRHQTRWCSSEDENIPRQGNSKDKKVSACSVWVMKDTAVRPTPLKAFFTPFSVAVVILTLGRFVWVCESSHCDLADRPLGTTFLSKPWSFICIQSMSYHRDKNTEDYGLNKLWTIT